MHARELNLPPRPELVARRLAGRPGLAFLWSADGSGPSYVASDPIATRYELDPEPDLTLAPRPFGAVPRWIGLLPYEYFRGQERPGWGTQPDPRATPRGQRPVWHRYGAVAVIGERVTVVGDSRQEVAALAERLTREPAAPGRVACQALETADSDDAHAARIRRALELIRAGDLYQVNIARRLRFRVEGHPLDVLRAMCRKSPGAYSCLLRSAEYDVVSTSPELLLRWSPDGRLFTAPIKGTRPRGRHAQADAEERAALAQDPKEHAELTMVIDVERNDLGRLARAGSVRVIQPPRVDVMSGLHHRWAGISARTRPDATRSDVFWATLPSGSVTGAPKVRAMEVIAELEAARRGLYTGGLGAITRDGSVHLAMAIRTLTLADGIGEYFVGGGIVDGSVPEREVAETRWKALQISRLVG